MATIPPLALSNIIDISVTVSPTAPPVNSFNVGLFVGPSTVIPSYGAGSRVQFFTSETAVTAAGFPDDSPEAIAAQIYFSQSQPAAQLALGRQDLTAIQTLAVNGRVVSDGSMTAASADLHSPTADFSAADVGQPVTVAGAGAAGAALTTTIATFVSATDVTLTAQAVTTVAAAQAVIGNPGSGFAVGDRFTVTQAGGSNALYQVSTVSTGGHVTSIAPVTQGTGYTVASGLVAPAVAPSAGTGLQVNITALGETLLEAVEACRSASQLWYGLAVNAPTDADNLAISQWADPLWQSTRYYPYFDSPDVANGVAGNIALQLQTLSLRVLGQYATTQNGLYPNNAYAAVALMGVEMGLNTGLANSFFTVAHKTLVGIAPEPLTQTQYDNIKTAGANVYGNFSPFSLEEPGFMSNGAPSYLWLNLAMLVAQLQSSVMAVLRSNPAVAQDNAGQQLLLDGANTGCAVMATIGFLAGSTWKGAPVNLTGLSLASGQALPLGYLNLSQPYSQQSTAARDAGQAMPIYTFITTAGAVQSLLIGVYTQL
jgi:hypothetical protein